MEIKEAPGIRSFWFICFLDLSDYDLQPPREVAHDFAYLDLLGADLLAASAGDAG